MTSATNSIVRSTAPRILVVEDDPLMRELMDVVFNIYIPDGTATMVHDAEHGLAVFTESEFDVLVTDINLPGMSGIDLIERVHEKIPAFPIVVHSGSRGDQIQRLSPDIQVVEKGRSGVQPLVSAVTRAFGGPAR